MTPTDQRMTTCDFCNKPLDKSKDQWLYQDDGSYIHIDCIEPALNEYRNMLDEKCPTKDHLLRPSLEAEFKLASKMDPREPFIEDWHETCEWCGHITDSPSETHVCPEKV